MNPAPIPATATTMHHLPARIDSVIWGWLCPHTAPVLHIASEDVVQVDTVSAIGVPPDNPADFFAEHDLPLVGAARDLVDILPHLEKGDGPHVLNGPIHIEDAEPGDVLEVQIQDITARAPYYGVNLTFPGAGSLPDLPLSFPDLPWLHVLKFDMTRNVACFEHGPDIPLAPFMGIMAVAPRERVSSIPPGSFGGNIDLRWLTAGARLYLPVHVPGALFYVGDGHGVQGDGEVNLCALETSLSGRLRFVLHKHCEQAWPLAETESHYIVMGLDEDLNQAAKLAVSQAVKALNALTDMTASQAYAFCSLSVNFALTQIVDGVKGVHGLIPKAVFGQSSPTWWGVRWH